MVGYDLSLLQSVAIRGERGSYNPHFACKAVSKSVAIRGERGSYNGLIGRL